MSPSPALSEVASEDVRGGGPEAERAPELLALIERTRLPVHVAAIMDGNGRWARARGLSRARGHAEGIVAVRDTVEAAAALGLGALTLFAFSVENWKRPADEVSVLMDLLKKYLRLELPTLIANDIRFRAIGRIEALPADVREMLDEATDSTAARQGLRFQVALNYGGRAEIVDAARRIAEEAARTGRTPDIAEEDFRKRLYTGDLPDPDLLIRTGGETRLSNFLLFQSAYTEFWTTDTFWPDFRRSDLYEAILDFQNRSRRYGGIS